MGIKGDGQEGILGQRRHGNCECQWVDDPVVRMTSAFDAVYQPEGLVIRTHRACVTGLCAGTFVFLGELLPGLLTMPRFVSFAFGYVGLLAMILVLEVGIFGALGLALSRSGMSTSRIIRWIAGLVIVWSWASCLSGPLPRHSLFRGALGLGLPCLLGFVLLGVARSNRWKILWGPVGMVSVMLLVVGTGPSHAPEGAVRTRAAEGPNLLVITIDTLRKDLLGCYGNQWVDTPVMDGLAAKGIRFDPAWSHVPMTLPSHATLFSGVLPVSHGVHLNGQRTFDPPSQTLAQILRNRGWDTGAFVAAYVLAAEFGLEAGFDVYDDSDGWWASRNVPRPAHHLVLPQILGFLGIIGREGILERPAQRVVDLALAWRPSQPQHLLRSFWW